MKIEQNILSEIQKWFISIPGSITAFSGGIDSALVLFLSRKYLGKEKAIGVISKSESLKAKDYKLAVGFTAENDIILETIHTDELMNPNYNSNPFNRCYYCKTHLYNEIDIFKKKYPNYLILNGTNSDDFSDYRPGLVAADENSIRSPLAELNIGKSLVRSLAKYYGIPFWNKPASPCLSSRIPYGNQVTHKKLIQVENAEEILNNFGFNIVRVRHYGFTCRIEVPQKDINRLEMNFEQIKSKLKALGFENCEIDKEGLVSGKLNRVLNIKDV